jgi:hypothetical protein
MDFSEFLNSEEGRYPVDVQLEASIMLIDRQVRFLSIIFLTLLVLTGL